MLCVRKTKHSSRQNINLLKKSQNKNNMYDTTTTKLCVRQTKSTKLSSEHTQTDTLQLSALSAFRFGCLSFFASG